MLFITRWQAVDYVPAQLQPCPAKVQEPVFMGSLAAFDSKVKFCHLNAIIRERVQEICNLAKI